MEKIEHTLPNGKVIRAYPEEICKCGRYLKSTDTCLACEKIRPTLFVEKKKKKSKK